MTTGEMILEAYRNQIGLRYPPIKCSTPIKEFRLKNCDNYYDWSTGKEIAMRLNSRPYNESLWIEHRPELYYLRKTYNDIIHDNDMEIRGVFWRCGHIPYVIPYPALIPPPKFMY